MDSEWFNETIIFESLLNSRSALWSLDVGSNAGVTQKLDWKMDNELKEKFQKNKYMQIWQAAAKEYIYFKSIKKLIASWLVCLIFNNEFLEVKLDFASLVLLLL